MSSDEPGGPRPHGSCRPARPSAVSRNGDVRDTLPFSVYGIRIARVNITVPDELISQAQAAGLNVSRPAASAVAEELDRLTKIAELDSYLAGLNAELGPLGDEDVVAAREWADQLTAGRHAGAKPGAT